jgi:hypothetical protein
MNKKGQLSIINIVFFVFIVAIGAVVTPILVSFTDTVPTYTNNSMAQTIATSIIVFFWLGIGLTFFLYIVPTFTRPNQ